MFYFIDIGLIVFSLMHICTYVIHLCRYLESKFLSHSVLFILQCSFQDVTTATISCIHLNILHAAAKSLQSCSTLCDPIDGSPPGSTILEILQARSLEWVAISFSNAWKWKVKVKSLSCVRLLATPWTAAHQAPLSMGFSRQQYWRGRHSLLQGIFPTQGLNSGLLHCR